MKGKVGEGKSIMSKHHTDAVRKKNEKREGRRRGGLKRVIGFEMPQGGGELRKAAAQVDCNDP